jgi:hypothetical protein
VKTLMAMLWVLLYVLPPPAPFAAQMHISQLTQRLQT